MAYNKKGGKKGKRPDSRPARSRYWGTGQLAINKVRRMMKSNGLSAKDAFILWEKKRTRHRSKMVTPSMSRIRAMDR